MSWGYWMCRLYQNNRAVPLLDFFFTVNDGLMTKQSILLYMFLFYLFAQNDSFLIWILGFLLTDSWSKVRFDGRPLQAAYQSVPRQDAELWWVPEDMALVCVCVCVCGSTGPPTQTCIPPSQIHENNMIEWTNNSFVLTLLKTHLFSLAFHTM